MWRPAAVRSGQIGEHLDAAVQADPPLGIAHRRDAVWFAEIGVFALKSGGRFAYTTPGPLDRNAYAGLFIGALRQHGFAPNGDDPHAPGGALSLSAPEQSVELMRAAGFHDARAEILDEVARFSSVDDYWDVRFALAGSDRVRAFVEELNAEQAAAVRSTLSEMLVPFEAGGELVLPMAAVTSVATA